VKKKRGGADVETTVLQGEKSFSHFTLFNLEILTCRENSHMAVTYLHIFNFAAILYQAFYQLRFQMTLKITMAKPAL
jgi:hypothetical protein